MRSAALAKEAQQRSIIARPIRTNARRGKFSSREIVDCERRSHCEGVASSAISNMGSPRSVLASTASSWPAAIISNRNRTMSAKLCVT